MNDIKHIFIPHSSTQEEDNEEKWDLLSSCMEKIEKQVENKKFETQNFADCLRHHGFNLGPRNYFIPNIDMINFDSNDSITCIF